MLCCLFRQRAPHVAVTVPWPVWLHRRRGAPRRNRAGSVPLPDGALDIAVFSLALMGSDYGLFLEEAARTLKKGGRLWIAEVSRASLLIDPQGNCTTVRQGAGRRHAGRPFALRIQASGWWLQVRSRFALPEENVGLKRFVAAVRSLGFESKKMDQSNRMFVVMEFLKKRGTTRQGVEWPPLKPCEYKRR